MPVGTPAGKKLTGLFLRSITPQAVVKTADESVANSITPQNDNELFLSVEANCVYVVTGYLRYSSTSGTPDIRLDFTGPSGATMDRSLWGQGTGASATSGSVDTGSISTNLGDDDTRGTLASSTVLTSLLFATLTTSSFAGTLQLRWAQATIDAANSVVLKAGSWLQIVRAA